MPNEINQRKPTKPPTLLVPMLRPFLRDRLKRTPTLGIKFVGGNLWNPGSSRLKLHDQSNPTLPILILCSQLTSLRQSILVRRFARFASGLISYKKNTVLRAWNWSRQSTQTGRVKQRTEFPFSWSVSNILTYGVILWESWHGLFSS